MGIKHWRKRLQELNEDHQVDKKVRFLQKGNFTTIKIPGEKHNLQQHSTLLVCGGRSRDLIGVHLKAIRGKYDLAGVSGRKRARSLYGVKKM